jgi:hypothetical protein
MVSWEILKKNLRKVLFGILGGKGNLLSPLSFEGQECSFVLRPINANMAYIHEIQREKRTDVPS